MFKNYAFGLTLPNTFNLEKDFSRDMNLLIVLLISFPTYQLVWGYLPSAVESFNPHPFFLKVSSPGYKVIPTQLLSVSRTI